jgi:small subunit ribosomal protein S4e
MAKMGSRKHLKRFKAPKNWSISPKENTWIVKPAAGPHAIEDSLSLLAVIRDILGLAENSREAKRIINTGTVLVDGRARKDYKYPVGFMDVIQIPLSGETYRVLPDLKGRLILHPIPSENEGFKLCKITDNFQFEKGALVLITGGKHIGEIGTINDINVNKSSNPNTVVIENRKKENFLTLEDYAFVIGKDKPAISLPGGN